MRRFHLLLASMFAVVLSNTSPCQSSTPVLAPKQKAVLVTGASSGIGRDIAVSLAAQGHLVYAGARKQADIEALNQIENVHALRLDVTVQADLDAAVATIRKNGSGLHGLVNNAGVAIAGPLIETDEADMQFQMAVNVFGPYRVTKAFAPLLIESKGRIATIGSISGVISGPFFGAYSMSKFAVEAYTDALAAEMVKFGVRVSVIEPGSFDSDIARSMHKRMEQRGAQEYPLFKQEMQVALTRLSADRSAHPKPDAVVKAVAHAMFDDRPKLRYMVVPSQEQADATMRASIERLVQRNHDQPFSHDRDGLIKLLDEALAKLPK